MTVYNQGACGSCYAFATLSSIFISLNINSSFSAFFSVQEILSCARNNNTLLGCKGGYL
jgi:C1A family cysteine protease